MAKISTYAIDGNPSLSDKVIGTEVANNNETKNYLLSDIFTLFQSQGGGGGYVPYTGATSNVNLGSYSLTTQDLILLGKLSANGSYGSTGNVLVSQGSGLPAVWQSAASAVSTYYGSFYDTTIQLCGLNAVEAFRMNTTVLSNGVSIGTDGFGYKTLIQVSNSGLYNIQFSVQLKRISGGSSKQAVIWLRVNGVDVVQSATHITMEANHNYLVAAWNFFQQINPGQNVQIMWTQDDAIELVADPVNLTIPYPATPSVILNVNKIA